MDDDNDKNKNTNNNTREENKNSKSIQWRESYYDCGDNEKDEMEKLLLKWQDPDDSGLLVTEEDLETWTLQELQTMCTIARDLTKLYSNGFSRIPKGSFLVERPSKRAIRETKESDERARRLEKNEKEKEKNNNNDDKNTEEKKFEFEEYDDDLTPMNDVSVVNQGIRLMAGKRSRAQFENDDWILNDNNNNHSVSNGRGFNGISQSILTQTNRRLGKSGGNRSGRPVRNKKTRKVNKVRNHMRKVKAQLSNSGKFRNIKSYIAPDGKHWYFRYNVDGKLICKCEPRPDGFDSDDDIENEDFWQDLIQRPFFHMWTNEVDQDGQRVYRNRVSYSIYFFFMFLMLCFIVFCVNVVASVELQFKMKTLYTYLHI